MIKVKSLPEAVAHAKRYALAEGECVAEVEVGPVTSGWRDSDVGHARYLTPPDLHDRR
jgi:hypothetical protein